MTPEELTSIFAEVVFSDGNASFGTVDFDDLLTSMPEINNVYPPAPPLPPLSDFIVPMGIGEKMLGTMWNYRHEILDAAGMIPVVGEGFDVLNAVLYAAEGDYTNAVMSGASAIPALGNIFVGGKWVKKGAGAASDLGKNLDNAVTGLTKKTDDLVDACSTCSTKIK